MKKLLVLLMGFLSVAVQAQDKGRFDVRDFGNFKLHVYYTDDALADISFIVEGNHALVTLETPLFKDNDAEFNAYLVKLGKEVTQRINNYHLGGTGDKPVVMPEGMPAFVKGDIYGSMMQNFAQVFGDAIVDLPTGKAEEVAFGSTHEYAGVPFEFRHGASSDFPGASILIGKKVYYTHWTPSKAHISHLQVSSAAAVDAEIAEAENSLASGAELFIGSHGGAVATMDIVKFKIEYLKKIKKLLAGKKTAEAFVEALKKAYPGLPGEEGLNELANALYGTK